MDLLWSQEAWPPLRELPRFGEKCGSASVIFLEAMEGRKELENLFRCAPGKEAESARCFRVTLLSRNCTSFQLFCDCLSREHGVAGGDQSPPLKWRHGSGDRFDVVMVAGL